MYKVRLRFGLEIGKKMIVICVDWWKIVEMALIGDLEASPISWAWKWDKKTLSSIMSICSCEWIMCVLPYFMHF